MAASVAIYRLHGNDRLEGGFDRHCDFPNPIRGLEGTVFPFPPLC
jgi:hypothetical protein